MRFDIHKLVAPLISFFVCSAAHAAAYTASFEDGVLSPHTYTTTSSGFSIDFVGGKALFRKSLGTGNGFARISTDFALVGDFTILVEMSRDNLAGIGEAGLGISYSPALPQAFADVWSYGDTSIVGNIFVPSVPGFGSKVISDPTMDVTLSMVRSGNSLGLYIDSGYGNVLVHSAAGSILTGPVYPNIFLGQETGNTTAHHVSFDNLSIVADAFSTPVPEPTSTALILWGLGFVGIVMRRRAMVKTSGIQ